MTEFGKSYKSVHFEFRPAKQVERRMMLDTFFSLMEVGFPIRSYGYAGMGSIYFVDYVLFHKYLGINEFISAEADKSIEERVKFNAPFSNCMTIHMGSVSEIIPMLSPSKKYILWLDYDSILNKEMLSCAFDSINQLSNGSIFIITVDVQPPFQKGDNNYTPIGWMNYFQQEADSYLWLKPDPTEFAEAKLPLVNSRIINNVIKKGLQAKRGNSFTPLFNFQYADGHNMLTLGGMISDSADSQKLDLIDRGKLFFLKNDLIGPPYMIKIPLLTRKERLELEQYTPSKGKFPEIKFELDESDKKAFFEIYRYLPSYTEMLL